MIRLYVEAPLRAGGRVEPTTEQARYLVAVMRRAIGDRVLLFNGRDGEWSATLAEIGRRGCVLVADAPTREQAQVPDLELVVALVKRARLETIVEKAAELGCRRVRLITTRRTNADQAKVERLQAIATEAAEQTGRLDTPEIMAPEKLERLLDAWDPSRRLMFCDEGEDFLPPLHGEGGPAGTGWGSRTDPPARGDDPDAPPPGPSDHPPHEGAGGAPPALDALRSAPAGPWAVLIGPEGGFDPAERTRLRGLDFVTPVSLGPRILRADTAAISALTLWQAALGDWSGRDRGNGA